MKKEIDFELPDIQYKYNLEIDHLKLKFYNLSSEGLKLFIKNHIIKKPRLFDKDQLKKIIENTNSCIVEIIPIYKDYKNDKFFEGDIKELKFLCSTESEEFLKIKCLSDELEFLTTTLNNYFYSNGFADKEYSIEDGYDTYHNKYSFKVNDSKEFKDKQLKLFLNEHLELIKEKIEEIEEIKNAIKSE